MEPYVIVKNISYLFEGKVTSTSDKDTIALHVGGREFLYYNLYYEVVEVNDEKVTFAFFYQKTKNGKKKWIEYPSKVTVEKGEEIEFDFRLDGLNRFHFNLQSIPREQYEKELEERLAYERLPLVERLRKDGKAELKDYEFVIKEHFQYRDVYSDEELDHEEAFDVIEGNKCKSYYKPDEYNFTIVKIIRECVIDLGGVVVEEGEEYSLEDHGGSYTNDGPNAWNLQLTVYLRKRGE